MKELESYAMETVAEKYAAMRNSAENVKDLDEDTVIEIDGWIKYEDVDTKTGEVKTLLTIRDKAGKLYGTISETFQKSFFEAWEFFDDQGERFDRVKVVHGMSNAGNAFVNCEIC